MKKVLLAIVLATLIVTACLTFVACDKEPYDKITLSLKFNLDYQNKSFWTDGVAQATVNTLTDGDTTTFALKEGGSVVIRYYGINTPESTTKVDKWGKAASLFNRQCLSNAEEIVLEAIMDNGSPEKEGYGRYLGYVWYRPKGSEVFKLLNLELVENGYTENHCTNTPKYKYYSYFKKAEDFAKSKKLHVFAPDDVVDPLYSTDPIDLTLKDFWGDPGMYYSTETKAGAKVRLEAYLSAITIGENDGVDFTVSQIGDDGQIYSLQLHAGYTSYKEANMIVGDFYNIVGTIGYYGDHYQLTSVTYVTVAKYQKKTRDTYVTKPNYYLIFDGSMGYTANYGTNLYGNFTVENISDNNGQVTITGRATPHWPDGRTEGAKNFTVKFTKPAGNALPWLENVSNGSKLTLQGVQTEEGVITVYDVLHGISLA